MNCPGSKLFSVGAKAFPTSQALRATLVAIFAFGPCCLAQNWDVGLAGGFSTYNDATIKTPSGASAQAGFEQNFAAGAALDQDVSEHIGGELRYTFLNGASTVHSNGTEANIAAMSQAIGYDFLFYGTPRRSRVRPFLAVGAGIKRYDGTGTEYIAQPLSNFALLRTGHQVEAMLSGGGGIKMYLSDRWVLRFDFRDFATPLPNRLFAAVPGTKVSGWLNDFVPMVGVDWTFGGR